MLRSALASCSAVLIMHAVFLGPSVVAVPCLRPVIASERTGQCILGPRSQRNNERSEVGVQSSTDVASDRVAVGHKLIATSCSLVMPTIVKAAALTCVALFNRNGERASGKSLEAATASSPCLLAEYALPPQRMLHGSEPNWSHEPTCAEYALPPQPWLPSYELNRNSSRARYALAPENPIRAAHDPCGASM